MSAPCSASTYALAGLPEAGAIGQSLPGNGRAGLLIDRMPPHDRDAEQAVLGSCLMAPEAFEEARAILQVGDFFDEQHRSIFDAMAFVHARGLPPDFTTILSRLKEAGQFDEIGGLAYLDELVSVVPTFVHVGHYAGLVKLAALRRDVISWSGQLAAGAYSPDMHPAAVLDMASRRLQEFQRAVAKPEPRGAPASWADMEGALGPVVFDWQGWLPRGMLVFLASPSGLGKSGCALRITSCYLRGDPWPDGTPYDGPLGAVLWCEAEAAQAINRGRAAEWDLPLERIYTPLPDPLADVDLNAAEHRAAILAMAMRDDVRLVVVDSFSGGSRRDENKSEAAEAAFWLAQLARDTGKPVLCLHHVRKRGMIDAGSDRTTLDMLRGYSGIVQPARVIWALDIPDPSTPDRKRLSVIKNNLGRFPDPIGLTIGAAGIAFGNAPERPRQESQLDKACDLLLSLLAHQPVKADELKAEADGAGISWDTMKRAKDKLGIVARRDGRERVWRWALPATI